MPTSFIFSSIFAFLGGHQPIENESGEIAIAINCEIYNFVEHVDPMGDTFGYIVMEYVEGPNLKHVLQHLAKKRTTMRVPLVA